MRSSSAPKSSVSRSPGRPTYGSVAADKQAEVAEKFTMKKYLLVLCLILAVLATGGHYFFPMLMQQRERSPEVVYPRLEELGWNKTLGELYDELRIAKEEKLDPEHRNAAGWRPLDVAASQDQWLAAAAFVVAGSNINATDVNGDTVIHIAVRHHAIHVLKELRRFMPDLNQKTQLGLSAIDLAHQLGDDAAVAALTGPFIPG
jgi:hypothetical protein